MRDATNERAGRRMTVYVSTIPPSTSDPTQLAEEEEKEEKEEEEEEEEGEGEEEEEEEEVTRGGYAERCKRKKTIRGCIIIVCICTYIYICVCV